MAIDSHYIPAFSIEDVILDKDTGAPLSGGLVYFEQDNQRGVLKPVYQITGTSPDYSYIQLPNPMTLSSIGTFEDSLSNPVVPYFYPYDAELNVELYYVRVTSSEDVPQFTREAVPYISLQEDTEVLSVITNELSNPQFVEVLFDTSSGAYTYSVNAVTDNVISIAPDWDLIVTAAGAGTVTVTQLAPTGSLNILTNPGTILSINSAGLSKLQLRQRIYGSPNLWGSGYISASFVAKTYSGTDVTLDMYYSQSGGTILNQLLVSATLPASGSYASFPGTVFIPSSTSPATHPTAYIDIYFDLPLSIQIDITSVMLAFTGATSIANIGYDQESEARQIDHLFHYYKPQLEYKPIPSYLVGWDFAINPSQFFSNGVMSFSTTGVTGANKSAYVWDQTIVFNTVDSAVSTARNTASNSLNITVSADTSLAIIQYIPQWVAREILVQRNAIKLQGNVSAGTLDGTVSLWWNANATLPDIKTPNYLSLVSAITAGVPTCGNGPGTWNKVDNPNYLNSAATFSLGIPISSHDFIGFEDTLDGHENASYMAIVICFDTMLTTQTLTIDYCSLVGGDIPTRPAPQTPDEVMRECRYYYRKSFLPNTTPVQNAGANTGESYGVQASIAGVENFGPFIRFDYPMRVLTGAGITLFCPAAASAEIRNLSVAGSYVGSGVASGSVSVNGFAVGGQANGGSAAGNLIGIHWVADGRLGAF